MKSCYLWQCGWPLRALWLSENKSDRERQILLCFHLYVESKKQANKYNKTDIGSPDIKNKLVGTSLVAQWLRIRLPMQGTLVRSLVQEDPTCCGATKPVRHDYWACTLEPMLCSKRSHHNEEPVHCNKE